MDYGMDDTGLFDDQPTGFARWVWPALIISVLLHTLFFLWLRDVPFRPLGDAPSEPPPPAHVFKLDHIQLDPRVLEPRMAEKSAPDAAPQAVQLPKDKPSFAAMMAENRGAPAAPKIDTPMLAEKPKIESTSYERTVQDAEKGGVKSVAKELDQVREDLLAEKPGVSGKPLLDLARPDVDTGGSPGKQGALAGAATPGFSNLDDLLAQTGPLTKETAPIRMDADVLYDYDSYQLQPQAVASLEKLGTIIRRNPQLAFAIEGHSDSHGPDDYNLQLSQYRAEAVKAWLVQNVGIDPARLTTRGFGKTRPLVPPGTIEEESVNRRVEIVLHDLSATP
ncbi:MAG: OmpA family protein [Terrimicrobiaceae bacterium]|nr:OmpA family protein [Terrimicrobiaceae bacterium]